MKTARMDVLGLVLVVIVHAANVAITILKDGHDFTRLISLRSSDIGDRY